MRWCSAGQLWLPAGWICVLLAASALCMLSASVGAAQQKKAAAQPARVNETTLARLRPGKSTLAEADRLYGAQNRTRFDEPDTVVSYSSSCYRSLQLDVDTSSAARMIQTITLRDLRLTDHAALHAALKASILEGILPPGHEERVAMGARWKTGRGIALGSTKRAVLAAYGAPQSSGPSVSGERQLELLYYAFDWAGTDVPQVLEITLEKDRVVQITLAASSL